MASCIDCGNHTNGKRCRPCYFAVRKRAAEAAAKRCERCRNTMSKQAFGSVCAECLDREAAERRGTVVERVAKVLHEESKLAPSVPGVPNVNGDCLVITDPHIPWHHTEDFRYALEVAVLLGLKTLVIAGDLIHGDTISKYLGVGKTVPITDELNSAGRALHALSELFEDIHLIPGNHDQRVEKMLASWAGTVHGRQALDKVAALLDVDNDAESIADGVFRHFYSSPKVHIHPLPQMTVNHYWLVQHPGSCSRVSPQTERKMAEKHRCGVIQGHNHLFGIGFDASGQDIAANIGHLSDETKYRYVRERPTHFPTQIRGFCCIVRDEDCPEGRLLPVAVHKRWFDVRRLAERLQGETA